MQYTGLKTAYKKYSEKKERFAQPVKEKACLIEVSNEWNPYFPLPEKVRDGLSFFI